MGWAQTAQTMVSRESLLSRRKPAVNRRNSLKFTIAREPALVRLRMFAIAQGPLIFRQAREPLYLLLLPPLAWIVLHLTLLNQRGFLDPYFYTGYVHNSKDLIDRYGLTYYSVRFGFILPAKAFTLMFGTEAGYVAFRYALTLLAGVPLYLLVKRNFGIYVALVTYCALITSPFFGRALFWDYIDASAIPYLLAAICLILLESRPGWLWDTMAGCLFGLALNSNAFTISLFGLFILVFVGASLLSRRSVLRLAAKLGWILAGTVLVCVGGCIYYHYTVGDWKIFAPTLRMMHVVTHNSPVPVSKWIAGFFHILVLPFVGLCCLAAPRSAWKSLYATASFGYIAVVIAYYCALQFLLGNDCLVIFYYFSYTLPAVFLSTPFIFYALWMKLPERHVQWLAALGVAGFVLPWILTVYGLLSLSHFSLLEFVGLASCTGVVVASAMRLRVPWSAKLSLIGAATVLTGATFSLGFAHSPYIEVLNPTRAAYRGEWNVYNVAMQFMDAVPKVAARPGGILFWYKETPDLDSIQSTYLWGYSNSFGMPTMSPSLLKAFKNPDVIYLGLLGESENEVRRGLDALTAAGFTFEVLDDRTFTSGSYRIYWRLISFTSR
jgi:hypothetical protein